MSNANLPMRSPLQDLPTSITCGAVGIVAAIVAIIKLFQPSKLASIPTVGSSSWLESWWAGLKYLHNAPAVLEKGYRKHKTAPFKVAEPCHWTVILSSREHLEELRKAPDNALSLAEAMNDVLQFEHMFASDVHHNPYHVEIVSSQLTRKIGVLSPEIRDEIIASFDDLLDLKGDEWRSIRALSTVQKVVCRTSNRIFVGLPLCRDPEWIDLNIQYSIDAVKGGVITSFFPSLLKPMATWLFTNINRSKQCARRLLCPVIEERWRWVYEYGKEWTDMPDDFLSWLMEEAEGSELAVESLTMRILAINSAAIHSASNSFTHILLYLAANPQYIRPLREEVEGIIEKEGWSKVALGKMRKVDSFVKECQRIEGISSVSLARKALKDFTFSDGTFIPKGTMINAAIRSIHHDEALYENANAFKPFRFADLHEEGDNSVQHQFVSTTTEYLPFGHGRHACPGRFFAANELKTMLAHVVVTYDIKLAENATPPRTLYFATATLPDLSAEVMFRRRVD